MSAESIEKRVAALEAEVTALKRKLTEKNSPWWKKWAGAFLNDPYFAQAVKYGRRYRESLRPRARKKRR